MNLCVVYEAFLHIYCLHLHSKTSKNSNSSTCFDHQRAPLGRVFQPLLGGITRLPAGWHLVSVTVTALGGGMLGCQ